MTVKRLVLVVTGLAVGVLGWVFAISQWETASRVATVASALAGVASVGIAIWAGLGSAGQTGVVVRKTGDVKSRKGSAISGYQGKRRGPITVEKTGKAESQDGSAISGYSGK